MGLVTSPPARWYLDCFGAIFCHQTFWLGAIQKWPSILSPSPSLCLPLGSSHVSKLKQQSNGRPTCKEGVLAELPCPRQLEPSNHTREPSPRVLYVPLLFGKHHLIYMHVLVCFAIECEVVCSQSCVSGWRLSVLPMRGHDGADATYSCSSFASYSCSSYS
jgi:hypothetical protein